MHNKNVAQLLCAIERFGKSKSENEDEIILHTKPLNLSRLSMDSFFDNQYGTHILHCVVLISIWKKCKKL